MRKLPAFVAQPGNLLAGIAVIALISLGLKHISSSPDADETRSARPSGKAPTGWIFGAAGSRARALAIPRVGRKSSTSQAGRSLSMVEPFSGWTAPKEAADAAAPESNHFVEAPNAEPPARPEPQQPASAPAAEPARVVGTLDHAGFGHDVNRAGGGAVAGAHVGTGDQATAHPNGAQTGPDGAVAANLNRSADSGKTAPAHHFLASLITNDPSGRRAASPLGASPISKAMPWSAESAGSALSWGGGATSSASPHAATSAPAAAAPAAAASPAAPVAPANTGAATGGGAGGGTNNAPTLQYLSPQQFVDQQGDFLVNYVARPASADFTEITRMALLTDADAASRLGSSGFASYSAHLQAAHDCEARLAAGTDNFSSSGGALDCEGTTSYAFTLRSVQAVNIAAMQSQSPNDQGVASALWDMRHPWNEFLKVGQNPPTYSERLGTPGYVTGILRRHQENLKQALSVLKTSSAAADVFADEQTELTAAINSWFAAFAKATPVDQRSTKASDAEKHLDQAISDAYTAAAMVKQEQQK